MLDRGKVIERLDQLQTLFDEKEIESFAVNIRDAVALLKGQEAKKVEFIYISRSLYAELTGYCPLCKRPLKERFNKSFCGNCGQAVKWE